MIKQLFSKYKLYLIGGAVIFVVLIPLGINALFKFPALLPLFSAEWSASDALSFYGAILTAIIGVIGVYWSIQAAQANYHEDKVNDVKPYFSITHFEASSKTSLFSDDSYVKGGDSDNTDRKRENYYKEYKLDKLYIVLDKNGITFPKEFNGSQQKIIKSNGLYWETKDKTRYALQPHNLVSIPFEIENVGIGTALDVRIAFYKKGGKRRWRFVFTFKPNRTIYCHIFSDDPDSSLYGEYVLEIVYADILENHYSQKFFVDFGINKESHKFYNSMSLIGRQEVINDGQT